MTRRLYYDDSYLTQFSAAVLEVNEHRRRIVLDQTAFYPASGGQPFDAGSINGIGVTQVIDSGDSIVHVLAAPLTGDTAQCQIDWTRRFDHMQQHTGQHLLSAVIFDLFRIPTVSFHMGAESSTIELGTASFEPEQWKKAEDRANGLVFENRLVGVTYEDSDTAGELRKPSERGGVLRIVSITGLDRSACGGTHVRQTGEIGPVSIRRMEKLRGNTRLEFLCGYRAIGRARADYQALSRIAQTFSSPLDDAPGHVANLSQRLLDLEKSRQKLTGELAQSRGLQLYEKSAPGPDGLRRYLNRMDDGGLGDEVRWEAQSYAGQPKAIYVAISHAPASVLLAVSSDAGINAGQVLKALLQHAGGKGGGNASLAQGSVPDASGLAAILEGLGYLR